MTLWNESRRIDRFLSGWMSKRQAEVFKKQLHKHPELADKVRWQKRTLQLVRLSARRQLKKELRQIEAQLLGPEGDTPLKNQITQIW